MKKSLRNHRIFFHRMGLLFLFIPLVVLIISIVLPDRGFSEKRKPRTFLPASFKRQSDCFRWIRETIRNLWKWSVSASRSLDYFESRNWPFNGKSGSEWCISGKIRISYGRVQSTWTDTVWFYCKSNDGLCQTSFWYETVCTYRSKLCKHFKQ